MNISYIKDDGDKSDDLHVRANYINTLLDHFWKRWLQQYVINLRETHKHSRKIQSSKTLIWVGDVVLIYESNISRAKWKIERIYELKFSTDGNVRSANVSVMVNGKKNVIVRPVNRSYPVEYNNTIDVHDENDKHSDDLEIIQVTFVDEKDIANIS